MQVLLIIRVPGRPPAVYDSLMELLDFYPTISRLCRLNVPGIQGRDISSMLDEPQVRVRNAMLCSGRGRLYREERRAMPDNGKKEIFTT